MAKSRGASSMNATEDHSALRAASSEEPKPLEMKEILRIKAEQAAAAKAAEAAAK